MTSNFSRMTGIFFGVLLVAAVGVLKSRESPFPDWLMFCIFVLVGVVVTAILYFKRNKKDRNEGID